MKRQIVWFTVIFLACGSFAEAQQPVKAAPKIGFIVSAENLSPQLRAFRLGLRDLGYVEGKNISIEMRYAEGRLDRMPEFVDDFVKQKIDLIVAPNNVAIRAAKKATKSIPIVMMSSIDPVEAGYAKSFTHPDGNITGLTSINRELSAKRVELLKDLLPKISRAGILWDRDGPGPAIAFEKYEEAAHAFKLDLRSFEARGPKPDFEKAFEGMKAARVEALIVVLNPLIAQHAKQIFSLAIKRHLASMTEEGQFVDAGGLISYGANLADLYRRAATYVDKILKGAKPADLPIEEPNRFELIINSKTAKQIGLTIPQNFLGRADRIVR